MANDGAGRLVRRAAFASPGEAADIVAADFDGAGHLDLAAGNTGYNNEGAESMTVLYGTGSGTFARLATYAAPFSPDLLGITGIEAGDVDGDPDLLLTGVSNDVTLYANNGAAPWFDIAATAGAAYSFSRRPSQVLLPSGLPGRTLSYHGAVAVMGLDVTRWLPEASGSACRPIRTSRSSRCRGRTRRRSRSINGPGRPPGTGVLVGPGLDQWGLGVGLRFGRQP